MSRFQRSDEGIRYWTRGFACRTAVRAVGEHKVRSSSLQGSQSILSCLMTVAEDLDRPFAAAALHAISLVSMLGGTGMHKHASYVRCTIEWAGLKKLTCVPSWLHNSHYREAYAQQLVHLETQAAATNWSSRPASSSLKPSWHCCHMALSKVSFRKSLSLLTMVEFQERPWQGHGKRKYLFW